MALRGGCTIIVTCPYPADNLALIIAMTMRASLSKFRSPATRSSACAEDSHVHIPEAGGAECEGHR